MKNREIKFRGKRIDNVEWVYGWLSSPDTIAIKPGDDYDDIPIIPESVGQFIGLKDKNGQEIYEGDFDKDQCVVAWCEKKCGWTWNLYDFVDKEFILCHCYNCDGNFEINEAENEIIGNIHEKPNLLRKNNHKN